MTQRAASRNHPGSSFKDWKRVSKLSYEEIAVLVRGRGQAISGGYIRLIVNGHRVPTWRVAVALSQITGGAVEPAALMECPRARPAAKRKRSAA